MTRDDVIRMAEEAGCTILNVPGVGAIARYNDIRVTNLLERFAELVADAERIKYQTEIQRLTDLANTAEKWRGIAMAKDGDGRTVQMVQEEAREAEREACLLAADEAYATDAVLAAIRARGAAGKESSNV